MSEANGNGTLTIPSVSINFGGDRTLSANLTDLKLDLNELAQQLAAEQKSHLDFCKAIVGLVQDRYGVAITVGEANDLNEQVELAFARKKKELGDVMQRLLGQSPSTESALRG